MPEKLNLTGWVRLFEGRLYNHDYLWFSSTEISKTSATLPALHNYALCYALAHYERGVSLGSTPTYLEDLAQMPLYATPAQPDSGAVIQRTAITFNALDSITLRTVNDPKPNFNTPDLGKRIYLNLQYESRQLDRPEQGYLFYLFAFDQSQPRSVIRLGKKGCPVRIRWREIEKVTAIFSPDPKRPTHLINPLDVTGQIERYEPLALPPHLLLRSAEISQDWFIQHGRYDIIHLPKSVLARVEGVTL
jgi:CRISPR-associated protein Csc1